MGIFDALLGQTSYRASAPRISTNAGNQAIARQARLVGQQGAAQNYALAGSARGANAALALREAQRRNAAGTQALGAQTLVAQQQLQQQAMQQQAQAEMQAQQINAEIAQANSTGLQRGIGAAVGAAAMMSDVRAKEDIRPLYSDFEDKEIGIRPEPARVFGPPMRPEPARVSFLDRDTEGRAAFGLPARGAPMAARPTLEQAAAERATIEELRNPAPTYRPQAIRPGVDPSLLSNRSMASFMRDRREAADLEAELARDGAGGPAAQPERESSPFFSSLARFGRGLESDFRSKELVRLSPATRKLFDLSPERIDRMADATAKETERLERQRMKRKRAFERLRVVKEEREYADRTGQTGLGMLSDFGEKEMSADESRAALRPVFPVNYRYKPDAAERMAREQGGTPEERAMVFSDKRAPRDGIIAQHLLRSPAFRGSVMDTPAGLAVERDRALSTNLAATAGQAKVNDEQDEELRDLKRMVMRYMARSAA